MRASGLFIAAAMAAALLGCGEAGAQIASLSGAERDARLAELERMATLGRPVTLPANATRLDATLARNDYPALRALMGVEDTDQAARMLTWSKIAVFRGANFAMSFFYATDLWTMAEAMERSAARNPAGSAEVMQQARTLKTTSALMALHTLTLLHVDGRRCADPQASIRHLADMEAALGQQWAFARGLPSDERSRLVAQAIRLEMETAAIRQPDAWLCTTQAAQMNAIVDGAASARPADDPNTPGRDLEVDLPASALFVEDRLWSSRLLGGRAGALETGRRVLALDVSAPASR